MKLILNQHHDYLTQVSKWTQVYQRYQENCLSSNMMPHLNSLLILQKVKGPPHVRNLTPARGKKGLNAHNEGKSKKKQNKDKGQDKIPTTAHDYSGHPMHSSKKNPQQSKPRDFDDL